MRRVDHMATQDYLKQAANMLRQAVTSKQTEIDDMRRTITQYEQEESARKDEIKRMLFMRQQQATRAEDSRIQATKQMTVQGLHIEEAQVNAEYANKIKDAQAVVV